MPFNGSGVFSLAASNPVVTGTVISSTWANNTLADISNGLTDCITKDGQSTPTQNIPMGTFKITGLGNGTNPQDAVALSQLTLASSPVGSTRNLSAILGVAGTSLTITADEIVMVSALGAQSYKLASFSKVINLATVGAGGMDTGVAPTSGFVAIYAIYNPTNGSAALLATNAATLQPNVYGGANMPSGYSISALLSVWPTNASKQFVVGSQIDRKITLLATTILSSVASAPSLTSLSVAGSAPSNAKTISIAGNLSYTTAPGSGLISNIASAASGLSQQTIGIQGIAGGFSLLYGIVKDLFMLTPQTIWYSFIFAGGTAPGITLQLIDYTI